MAKRATRRPGKPGKKTAGKRSTGKRSPHGKAKRNQRGGDRRFGSDRPSNDPPSAPRRRRVRSATAVNLPPREAGERIQKLMASAGIASRRECEVMIQEGRVQVDGEVITELGVRVDPFKQRVAVDGEPLPRPKRVYYAVNKPDGVVCTARDPSGRPRVTDLLPPDVGRVFNVGRLDMASEGLILLTNDGELANRLTHPRHGVEKIYHVQVSGRPTPETLAQLRRGVYLSEGKAHFVHAKIKSHRKSGTVLEVVLDEGRNREIRRVLARVGHKVQRLTRVAVGPVRLADLPSGAYRPLTAEEVRALRAAGPGSQRQAVRKAASRRSASKQAASEKTTEKKTAKRKATSVKRSAKATKQSDQPKRVGRRVILGDDSPPADNKKAAGKQSGGRKPRKGTAGKSSPGKRGSGKAGQSRGHANAKNARKNGRNKTTNRRGSR